MTRRNRTTPFREQMRQSMAELQAIMDRRESPLGEGRFTVRTIEVAEPSLHDARSVRALRTSLNVSQGVFARVLGVSAALVRAWELGTRLPAPIARRLLDLLAEHPSVFAALLRTSDSRQRPRLASMRPVKRAPSRGRKVA